KAVYKRFQIDPKTISLVETHGTGTLLGDPIEIDALKQTFGPATGPSATCALGALKANIGHLLAASGVASVITVLLSMRPDVLAPHAQFRELNPHISLEDSPFYINREPLSWSRQPGKPRRVAVSAFGYSGTNAHIVIEDAPDRHSASTSSLGGTR